MRNDPLRLLFIDPYNLSRGSDLQIANGFEIEIVPGPLTAAILERVLRDEYDAIHWFGHGKKGLLCLSETEELDAADLVGMLKQQHCLRFMFLNACDGSQVATTLHNSLHVPIVAHDDEILTTAARHFASVFYRRYKQAENVGEAFETGKESLLRQAAKFPGQAVVPVLINGDMATVPQLQECMTYVKANIGAMSTRLESIEATTTTKLESIEATVNEIKGEQSRVRNRQYITILVIGVGLLLAQLATPWLNALLAVR